MRKYGPRNEWFRDFEIFWKSDRFGGSDLKWTVTSGRKERRNYRIQKGLTLFLMLEIPCKCVFNALCN